MSSHSFLDVVKVIIVYYLLVEKAWIFFVIKKIQKSFHAVVFSSYQGHKKNSWHEHMST